MEGNEDAKKQLYMEPVDMDTETKEIKDLQKMFGISAEKLDAIHRKNDKDLLNNMETKKDNTTGIIPKLKKTPNP